MINVYLPHQTARWDLMRDKRWKPFVYGFEVLCLYKVKQNPHKCIPDIIEHVSQSVLFLIVPLTVVCNNI